MRVGLATLVALAEAGDEHARIMCRLWHVRGPDFGFEVWASHGCLWRVRVPDCRTP